ncbi:MAG TPA: efflux RND transporter periplasmic adaptor subunit [Planctomycetes bacterium]|nr:efflux RND transporter periplasmic adaptor subunit [Planctomycetota bacterium]
MDWKRLLIFPPLALGVVVLAAVASRREGAAERPPSERARTVRVLELQGQAMVPIVRGHGLAQPGAVWQAVAQVSAEVAALHSGLKPGELVKRGTVLVRFDTTDIELAIRQTEAALRTARAELNKLAVQRENDAASLQIEERALAVSRNELQRAEGLNERGTLTENLLDQQRRAHLAQEAKVQSLRNALRISDAQREVLEANVALNEAKLASAERDLTRSEVKAPFDARIARLEVEAGQFAPQGQLLLAADSIEVTEVHAQFVLAQLNPILRRPGMGLPPLGRDAFWERVGGERFAKMFGIDATVFLRSGELLIRWPARFVRASPEVDPVTRTIGVVVAVDQPYRQARPGVRPPLVKGMFCEVEVRGAERQDALVIPRGALHEGDKVWIADAEQRLRERQVVVELRQDELVTLASGLEPGERLVVSDPVPAVEGMLLDPQPDLELAQRLSKLAQGSE